MNKRYIPATAGMHYNPKIKGEKYMYTLNCYCTPLIGEVYMMNFTGDAHEQAGWRPGVVLQNNIGNANSSNVIVVPLTSAIKKTNQPTHVVITAEESGLDMDSMVLCENPKTIAKTKIGRYMTRLSAEQMRQIAIASTVATSAISYLTITELFDVWLQTIRLNRKVEYMGEVYQNFGGLYEVR